MRIRAYVVLTALLLAPAAGAIAQETPNTTTEPGVGSVDFGGQFSTINGDEARYQRYKDMRSGGLLDAFKYTREKENWLFDVTANHVGYRDQKFVARFRHYERARLSFTWDQIPLFYAEPDSAGWATVSTGSTTPCRRRCRRSARPRRARPRRSQRAGRPPSCAW
jgi:hypothetical protein